jgi:hypothetical protein
MFGEELGRSFAGPAATQQAILAHDESLGWTVPRPRRSEPLFGEPPYRGLEYFDVDDAARFGRSA